MKRQIVFGACAWAIALLAPPAADAQNGTENYYTPPKIVKTGTNKTPVAGAGTVVVQVFVKSDGTFKVQRILKSTNHADNAAATEIASTATYASATRGGKPTSAFYDYTLKFTASGQAAAPASGGGVAELERQIRAGNYSGAQTGLKAYLAAHPGDAKAQLDLAVTNTYLSDAEAATTAFDKAGTLPDEYKPIAAKAYGDYAAQLMKQGDYPKAVVAAKRSVALGPSVFSYNALGTAEAAGGDSASAITDLEKARALGAQDANVKPADRARVDANLVSAYVSAGKLDSAKEVAAEAAHLDPSESTSQTIIANYYLKSVQDLVKAGKFTEAAQVYEQAAAAVPSQAGMLYTQAAVSYLKAMPKPDNDKAKADADKALALDPDDAHANYAAGIALANQAKTQDALVYLNKADASAKKSGDAAFVGQIESAIKQLNGTK